MVEQDKLDEDLVS